MLSNVKLLKSFQAEAMRPAVDLINLSSSAPLDGDVPERFQTGNDISYKHLRVFDCRAYIHILDDELSKLDDKAKEYIFLGYGYEEFGYIIWDLVVRKLIRSRDIVFLKDYIGYPEKSDEFESSPEIFIIPISVSLHVVHKNHGRAEEDNNNGPE